MTARWLNVIPVLLMIQLASAQIGSINLIEFSNSSCDEETDPYRLRTRIIKKNIEGKILTIEIGTTDTCCVSFKPVVSATGDILNLDLKNYGDECECICCYQFVFKIEGNWSKSTAIKFRGKDIEMSSEKFRTYPIRFEIRDTDTVNYVDKYGLKQGRWYPEKLGVWDYYDFVDGINIRSAKLHANGTIKKIGSKEKMKFTTEGQQRYEYYNWNHLIEFYENGAKKRECFTDNWKDSYKEGICKDWNEKGELVYEGPYKEN